jgi:hypothetical protein
MTLELRVVTHESSLASCNSCNPAANRDSRKSGAVEPGEGRPNALSFVGSFFQRAILAENYFFTGSGIT